MRRRIIWRSAAAISMLGLAPAIGAAFAAPAGASTYACAAALGTQCGTFTASAAKTEGHAPNREKPGNNGGLGWDVKYASSAINTPLIEGPNYSPGIDPGTDLTKVEHYGPIPGSQYHAALGYWYSFVYTPSGQWTSMCVSNPDNPGRDGNNLVLRPCNQLMWQAFMYVKLTGPPTPPPPPPALPPTLRKPQHNTPPSFLPTAPRAPRWRGSEVIPNSSTTTAYALYSVANRRFVEVTRSHGMSVADFGFQGRALSATAHSGEHATDTNSWFWTNANGTGPGHGSGPGQRG